MCRRQLLGSAYWEGFPLFSSLGTWGHVKASRSHRQDAGQRERRGCFFLLHLLYHGDHHYQLWICEHIASLHNWRHMLPLLWPLAPVLQVLDFGTVLKINERMFARLNGGVGKDRSCFAAEQLLDRSQKESVMWGCRRGCCCSLRVFSQFLKCSQM